MRTTVGAALVPIRLVVLAAAASASALALAGVPGKAAAAPARSRVVVVPDPGGLSGLWISGRFNADRDAQRGGPRASPEQQARLETSQPPLTPWARQILDQRQKDAAAGHPFAFTKARCLPAGTPQSMFPPAALPIQILLSPGQVTILFEEFNQFRVIRMNARHAADPDPGYFGDSVGRWEGDTLVIDTVGITDQTTLGNVGLPHSEQLHVVERLRRTGPDTLEVRIALDDPKAFQGVWHLTNTLKRAPGMRLSEYFCDNDRNTPDASGRSGIQLPSSR